MAFHQKVQSTRLLIFVSIITFSIAVPSTAQETRFSLGWGILSYSETLTALDTQIETDITAFMLGISGLSTYGEAPVGIYSSGSLVLPQSFTQESDGQVATGDLDVYDSLFGSHLMIGIGGLLVDTETFALAIAGGPRMIFLAGGYSEYLGYPFYTTVTYSFSTAVLGVQGDIVTYVHFSDIIYLFANLGFAADFYASGSAQINSQTYDTSGSVDAGSWSLGTGIGFKFSRG